MRCWRGGEKRKKYEHVLEEKRGRRVVRDAADAGLEEAAGTDSGILHVEVGDLGEELLDFVREFLEIGGQRGNIAVRDVRPLTKCISALVTDAL